ncbi:MmgE/PrpD family protein [Streptomyces nogalater]|uniref:VlmK n=2 Tax=Streptomyces TaxID=1883 RepID=Q84F27_STRVF|nr:VlmK [Streptomyces viridifaciens]
MDTAPAVGERGHGQLALLAEWASSLELSEVPDRVQGFAASHILSQLAAIRSGLGQEDGKRLVTALGRPWQDDVAQSARVLSAAGAWLNLDDTAFAGHLGPSTVGVPIAYAHHLGLSGRELLRAVIIADECAARVTASATLGPFRGQTALHTHVVGAVAGRLACERAPADVWVDALALALSAPPWTLMRGFVTTDARLLHVPVGVRMGLDACDAAHGGLHGAADVLEHEDGFLHQFADVPLPEAVTRGLGQRWHTETLSFKLHPGGPGIDAAIDCAVDLHNQIPPFDVEDVEEVLVEGSLYTMYAARKAEPYLAGPETPIGALVLTTPYPVATALLTGRLSIHDFSLPEVGDTSRWALAEKVRLVHDRDMTRILMRGDAPFGEALRQAGDRACAWLRRFGGQDLVDLVGNVGDPLDEFIEAVKPTPARVSVRMTDGRTYAQYRAIPRGGIGPDLRTDHQKLVAEKWIEAGGPEHIVTTWPDLVDIGPDQLARLLESALAG